VLGPLDQVGAGKVVNLPQVRAQGIHVPHVVPVGRKRITDFLAALGHDERVDARVMHRDGLRLRGRGAIREPRQDEKGDADTPEAHGHLVSPAAASPCHLAVSRHPTTRFSKLLSLVQELFLITSHHRRDQGERLRWKIRTQVAET